MKCTIMTTMFITLVAHAALARPPVAELDGQAPFIGSALTASQSETVRTLTSAWRCDAAAQHVVLTRLHDEEEDLVEANGPVKTATLNAILAHEEAISHALATERVRNEVTIHDLLSPEQLTEAARTMVVWARPGRSASSAEGRRNSAASAR